MLARTIHDINEADSMLQNVMYEESIRVHVLVPTGYDFLGKATYSGRWGGPVLRVEKGWVKKGKHRLL